MLLSIFDEFLFEALDLLPDEQVLLVHLLTLLLLVEQQVLSRVNHVAQTKLCDRFCLELLVELLVEVFEGSELSLFFLGCEHELQTADLVLNRSEDLLFFLDLVLYRVELLLVFSHHALVAGDFPLQFHFSLKLLQLRDNELVVIILVQRVEFSFDLLSISFQEHLLVFFLLPFELRSLLLKLLAV